MKVKLFIASTLDGYIATKDDNLDWLFEVEGDGDNGYSEFYQSIDIIIMGKNTYDWLKSEQPDSWPYSGKECYVFTHKKQSNTNHVKFIEVSNLIDFSQKLIGNVWVVGGGNLIKDFLENHLIDEIQVTIAPVLLGDGIPLFPTGNYAEKLELIKTKTYGQFVELNYAVKK